MSDLNQVTLTGRLGQDPETRTTSNDNTVCNFSLATGKTWKNKDGEKQERTEWHRIVVWGKLAEICQKYLKKGKQVLVQGELQTRKWEDKDGNTRYTTEVNLSGPDAKMIMLGSKSDSEGGGSSSSGSRNSGGYEDPGFGSGSPDDDIPF